MICELCKKISQNKLNCQIGFAAIFSTLIVLTIVSVIVAGVAAIVLTGQKIARNAVQSAQAFYSAEAGVEDNLYRIIKGKKYQAGNNLAVGSATAAINISGAGNQKTIRVEGEQSDHFRNLEVKLDVSTADISFFYGVQVGEGGLTMNNNSTVSGSVYSNGPVQGGGNNSIITGDAWVASIPAAINQEWTSSDSGFIFGRQLDQIDAAQSFIPSISDKLTKIGLYLKKTGSPSDKTVRVLTDNGGKPSKTLAGSSAYGTLSASQISQNSYGWINVTLNSSPLLQAGNRYWIVIDTAADNNDYFSWAKDSTDGYTDGTGNYSPNWNAGAPLWYAVGGDLVFKTWLGSTPNALSGISVGANAHANTITNCEITGDAYFQTISGSTVAGTQYPNSDDPPMEQMPISESNISDWQAAATAGGTLNGYTLTNFAVATLGPKKIIGDLTLSNGADLTLNGTLYVTGSINISNGAKLRLAAGYGENSGVIVTDGFISVSNNAVFYANGAGTYIMLLSTKSGDAINISNNANTVIFYASAGNVSIANNANLKEVTAYKITLANNAQITYESGLASAKFSTGTGAGWSISSWKEVP